MSESTYTPAASLDIGAPPVPTTLNDVVRRDFRKNNGLFFLHATRQLPQWSTWLPREITPVRAFGTLGYDEGLDTDVAGLLRAKFRRGETFSELTISELYRDLYHRSFGRPYNDILTIRSTSSDEPHKPASTRDGVLRHVEARMVQFIDAWHQIAVDYEFDYPDFAARALDACVQVVASLLTPRLDGVIYEYRHDTLDVETISRPPHVLAMWLEEEYIQQEKPPIYIQHEIRFSLLPFYLDQAAAMAAEERGYLHALEQNRS